MPSLKAAFEKDRDFAGGPAKKKTVSVSYDKLAPWLIGRKAPTQNAWNLANSEAYQWKVAKLQYTDRLPKWFLDSIDSNEAADQSKESSKEECSAISTNVGAAIAVGAAGRATAPRRRRTAPHPPGRGRAP